MALEHLFDAKLQYRPGMAPLTDEGEGALVGSGNGTVTGRALTGALRWTLFEQPGALVCATSPTLQIDTTDGADIRAEGRGFAARDRTEACEWRVAATLRFPTDDARYAWLDGALGLWEGEFDAEQHRARYLRLLQRRGAGTPGGGCRLRHRGRRQGLFGLLPGPGLLRVHRERSALARGQSGRSWDCDLNRRRHRRRPDRVRRRPEGGVMPTTVDREQVQRLMSEDAQVVEVLPPAEFEDEHLPGAINIPLKELDRERVVHLARERPVLVYCYDYQ